MAINYQGRDIQQQSELGLRLENIVSYDYSAYDTGSGEGAVEIVDKWLVADDLQYVSSIELDPETKEPYSASYFVPTVINISGSFYGSLSGTATSASYALSASYAPLSIDTSSFYISSPGNILFVNRYLLIAKGDGNIDVIDLSTLEAASASYASYALTASYAMNGGGGGAAFPFTGSAIISGSLTITGSFDVGVPGTNSPRITSVGTLNRGDIVSVDWVNRNLQDTSTLTSVDWESRILNDTSAVTSVDWSNRALYDTNLTGSVSWNERTLYDSAGNPSADWEGRFLYDSTGNKAHSYETRDLIYPNNLSALNYGTQNRITMSGSVAITGSLTVSGSSTFTNIGPAIFLGSFNQGSASLASGLFSHVQGLANTASGIYSHAEGQSTQAIGAGSHAEGLGTVASGSYQHVQGQYNISSSAQSAFIIGNGVNASTRSNLVFASGSQVQITGSLIVSGSSTFTNIGPAVFSGSVNSQGGFTGSLQGTASYATQALTASFALTSAGGGTAFPFTGSARITGSLNIIGTTTITGSLLISGSISQLSVFRNFDTGSTVGPGGSAATASLSFAIPANTFKPRDVVRVKVRIAKTATGGNTTVTIFHNYTNTLLGANNLGIFTGNASLMQLERTYNLLPQGGVSLSCELESAGVGTSLATDNTATNRLITTTDFFLSSFLIVAISNTNATDTARVTMVTIERV